MPLWCDLLVILFCYAGVSLIRYEDHSNHVERRSGEYADLPPVGPKRANQTPWKGKP